jgi:SAM-dependent methyltransferase
VPYPPSPYDPAAFRGAAPYYTVGRPAYSPQLCETLRGELGLDGAGRLLDVGCGPGTLALQLAPLFEEVVGLDPEPGMLREARRAARAQGVDHVRWIKGVAEDIDRLGVGPCRLVTFGQSFHRTDRQRVADLVYDLLEPDGAVALVCHMVDGRPTPPSTGHPNIPNDEIEALVERYLGPRTSADTEEPERWEVTLANSRFGGATIVYAPGLPDLVRDTDSVVAGYFSMSWATPPRFGDDRERFETDLRALLSRHSPDGLFWDWPGDTEIVYARKNPAA